MASSKRPKCVIFDLDGCVWTPEMFELWGGGASCSALCSSIAMESLGAASGANWRSNFGIPIACNGTRPEFLLISPKIGLSQMGV